MNTKQVMTVILRVALGLVFLWAFFDKLFGLGFATSGEKAWIHGGSPTTGFLANGVHGPLASFYHSLAGVAAVDWLFMIGLLCIGISLVCGIWVRTGTTAGIVMMLLMYSALFPPENNPLIDDHVIYALALGLIAASYRRPLKPQPSGV